MWKIEEALQLIRELQPKAWDAKYALALGGSVLNHGESYKDLDIIATPLHVKEEPDGDALLKAFSEKLNCNPIDMDGKYGEAEGFNRGSDNFFKFEYQHYLVNKPGMIGFQFRRIDLFIYPR